MCEENATLPEALAQVDRLEELLSPSESGSNSGFGGGDADAKGENQPNIEAQVCSIAYQVNFDTNFEDRNGFVTGIAKYNEEATVHAALNELLVEGEHYAATLYTWRCCSRGIPQSKSNDDPRRLQIYKATVEVLGPEVEKLFKLLKFQKLAIDRFCKEVRALCHAERRKEFVSEAYLLTLGKIINMFAILDELKNVKASVKNDFSTYKRAAQFIQTKADSQVLIESQNLSVFLATNNKIRTTLKKNLETVPNYADLLCEIINISVSMFERKLYLGQAEKHMLVKVIGFSLDLIDNDRCTIYKLDQSRKIRLEKIDRIFRVAEVVPLFGDMQISPFDYVRRSKHFVPQKWPLCTKALSAATCGSGVPGLHIDVSRLLPQISSDHLKFICELQEAVTTANFLAESETAIFSSHQNILERSEKLSSLCLRGLQLLSEWTTTVSELYSWKLLHPTDHHQNPVCPPEAEEYERATRYNYTEDEKSALVKVISLIKGLQSTMSKLESLFGDAVRRDVYFKLQTFVQETLREPLRKSAKNKKTVLRSILIAIRDTCGDWMGSMDRSWALAMKGQKGPANVEPEIGDRVVGPSSTQLYLLRTMLESLISEKLFANKNLRKYLDDTHAVPFIQLFYEQTFFWSYLFNFGDMLNKCCDLSQFWYREFYLEMTMGRRMQFPIAMSMPWILLDHSLSNPSMIEFVLYPLDLYNDSCGYALNVFRKQYLYDELEAEVNLCFDQLVFALSTQIFCFYKKQAAADHLDKQFKVNDTILKLKRASTTHIAPYKYETLMKQRRVYLLGHYIDLNKLIRQRISKHLLESLKVAIGTFQEGDLTNIVQLKTLIDINRKTHTMLKKFLPGLDEFDWILREANHNITSPHGRTTFHIFCELNFDFLPNYCYNGATNRFVKSARITFSDKAVEHREKSPSTAAVPPQYLWGSKQLGGIYTAIFSQYKGFIGEPHFRAMSNLLGYHGIAVIIQEMLKIIKLLITGPLQQHVRDLFEVMPTNIRGLLKTLSDGGSLEVLSLYYDSLREIIRHPSLRITIFQQFRELGNALLFCLQIEKSLALEEVCQWVHSIPFLNVHPLSLNNNGKKYTDSTVAPTKGDLGPVQKQDLNKLEKKMSALHVLGNLVKFGTETQRKLAADGSFLSVEKLSSGLSMFQALLGRIKEHIWKDSEIWTGPRPENHVMHIDEGTEFHRLWSAMQFVFCLPVGQNELTVEQLYGDGLNWAGCLLIAVLEQQRRFETFDFSSRLLESYRLDRKDGIIKGVSLRRMVRRIRSFQILNAEIFSVLNKYISEHEATLKGDSADVELIHSFPPPIHKILATKREVETTPTPSEENNCTEEALACEVTGILSMDDLPLPPPPDQDSINIVYHNDDEVVSERVTGHSSPSPTYEVIQ